MAGTAAATATAGLVVLLVVVAPRLGGGDATVAEREPETPRSSTPAWRTASIEWDTGAGVDRLEADLPGDWRRLDTSSCEFPVAAWGLPGVDPCEVSSYSLAVYGGANFDSPRVAGSLDRGRAGWSGHVVTGDAVVVAGAADRVVTRRVLASVRLEGDPAPDVATWSTRTLTDDLTARTGEITVEVPADPGVTARLGSGTPFCAEGSRLAVRRPDGRWTSGRCRDRVVTVTAPTQALADVVAATVRGY